MKAGDLRHILRVDNYPTADDGTPVKRGTSGGVPPHDWQTFCTLRGAITPTGGQERLGGMAYNAQSTHKVMTRFFPGITPGMRIVDACNSDLCPFNGKAFEILSVNAANVNGSNRVELDFECREGRSHGNV